MIDKLIDSRLTSMDELYPTCARTCATIRIYPFFQSANEISKTLGLVPTRFQDKGEQVDSPRGRVREIKGTGWFLSSEGHVDSLDLRSHLNWILERLLPRKEQLKELQSSERMKMSLVCIWWSVSGHGGPCLWPEQMSALSELNLECSFDIYFIDSEE